MNFKTFLKGAYLLMLMAMTCVSAHAGNISATTAQQVANRFLKHRMCNAPGAFKSVSLSDIQLSHAEPSSVEAGAIDYYVFNINGGGFIIIAGEDRAEQVLGYDDKGRFDVNNLPDPLRDLLDNYKRGIEFLQTHKGQAITQPRRILGQTAGGIEPMTKTEWGQEMPYYTQNPMKNGKYSKVGCAGAAMLQMCYFWKYPISCGPLPGYYASRLSDTVPALPGTTFDYRNMLLSYGYWDWDATQLVQGEYTDEQALAVATLARYCSQAALMNFSPDVSTTNEAAKLNGMKTLGYNTNAISINNFGNTYTTEQWDSLLRVELDAGRPVMYASDKPGKVGHAFIIDGYNDEGYFHINMGWYSTNNGWYLTTAIVLISRYDAYRDYSEYNRMIRFLEPPLYCILECDGVEASNDLYVLGDTFLPTAKNVWLNTSYRTVDLGFTLTDSDGHPVATGDNMTVQRHLFEQECDVCCGIVLPTTLSDGKYQVQFNCCAADSLLATGGIAPDELTVVGKFAKYGKRFDVADVSTVINYVLQGTPKNVKLDVGDIAMLINHILQS